MASATSRLKLIGVMMAVVLAGYLAGAGIDWLRLPGVALDRTPALDALAKGEGAPSTGPADAALTMVVFTDYQCSICRIDHPEIADAAASQPGLRIVFKEWAILGPASRTAARLALAAAYQGRYPAMRDALMSRTGRADAAGIRAAAVVARLDWSRLQRDLVTHRAAIDAELARTGWQAYGMGLPGTPAYLIGNRLVVGRLSGSKLRRLIGA